jgi:hypothetical protein
MRPEGEVEGKESKVGVTQRAGIMVPCSGTCRLVVPVQGMKA